MKRTDKKHGLIKHTVYYRWSNIKSRCYNEKDPGYKNYGARGIGIYYKWRNDFKAFYDYVMSLPDAMKPGYTLDRTNNYGGYDPGNLRWVGRAMQKLNSRMQKNNTSGYIGINQYHRKYRARIKISGKYIYIGLYSTIYQAVAARDNYIIKNKLTDYKLQLCDTIL